MVVTIENNVMIVLVFTYVSLQPFLRWWIVKKMRRGYTVMKIQKWFFGMGYVCVLCILMGNVLHVYLLNMVQFPLGCYIVLPKEDLTYGTWVVYITPNTGCWLPHVVKHKGPTWDTKMKDVKFQALANVNNAFTDEAFLSIVLNDWCRNTV